MKEVAHIWEEKSTSMWKKHMNVKCMNVKKKQMNVKKKQERPEFWFE